MAARVPKPESQSDIVPGTLDMLILKTLTIGPMHGYSIAQHIARLTKDVLRVEQGSLYPALERLQKKGWATSRWRASPTGRQARYYTITAAGRRHLGETSTAYQRAALAIARVMRRA